MRWDETLYYDETSPSCLRWKVNILKGNGAVRVHAGEPAGSLSDGNYWMINTVELGGKLVHRIIYEMLTGEDIGDLWIDHIDGDPSNNQIGNLRKVDIRTNARNRRKNKNNTTGITGVSKHSEILPSGTLYECYRAYWVDDLSGKRRLRTFSINKYGEELAEFLAVETREYQILLSNLLGGGYSMRHGT